MDDVAHREVAVAAYRRCWELLEAPYRDDAGDAELLGAAFTSRDHWGVVGGPEQWAVGDWMISRALAALGEGRLAVTFAARADAAGDDADLPDWLRASTAEGLARAYAAAGDEAARDAWRETAQRRVAAIADDDDRALIAGQLATVPR
ncbi:MAG: hypothetical protein ACHQFZ_08675 [Acidimicrobiales bacterium]